MTRDFIAAHPGAVPGYLVVGLLSLCAAPIAAERNGAGTLRWWGFLTSTGGFVVVDLSPAAIRPRWVWSSHLVRSWAVHLPSLRELGRLADSSVNLVLAVPLGLTAVLLAQALRRPWPLAVAVLPVACELAQGAAPGLGRHGLLMTDLVLNEIGLGIGGLTGGLLALGVRAIPRRAR